MFSFKSAINFATCLSKVFCLHFLIYCNLAAKSKSDKKRIKLRLPDFDLDLVLGSMFHALPTKPSAITQRQAPSTSPSSFFNPEKAVEAGDSHLDLFFKMPQGSIITVQIRIKRASCQNDFKLEQKERQNTRQSQELRLKLACELGERVFRVVLAHVILWVYLLH